MNIAVLLSGGVDSTTVLAGIVTDPSVFAVDEIHTISFKYPSKHNELELEAASNIALHYKTEHHVIDLTSLFESFQSNLLTNNNNPIPEGHYEADNMKQTVVPMRNIIFASVAAGYLNSLKPDEQWDMFLGVHQGDHAIYPDCRPKSIIALMSTIGSSSDRTIRVAAPMLNVDKTEIVKHGLIWGAPLEKTRTCYTSYLLACGKCGSCTERLEAFASNGVPDPAHYAKK